MSSDPSKTIIGVVCKNGIVLAINELNHHFFYVGNAIYFCSENQPSHRDALMAICKKLEEYSLKSYTKMTVETVVSGVVKEEYEQLNKKELLLAGLDSKGLHLYAFYPLCGCSSVKFVALGERSKKMNKYLKKKWKADLDLKQGEELARKAFHLSLMDETSDNGKMEIGIIYMKLKKDDDELNECF